MIPVVIPPSMPWLSTGGAQRPTTRRQPLALTGVSIGLFPSNSQFIIELQRSTQSSTGVGSSSKWLDERFFSRGNNTEVAYNSVLPMSTQTYYWRARQTMPGWNAGPWTTVLHAKPTYLTLAARNVPSMATTALRALRTISTADNTLTTATKLGTTGVTKLLRIPAGVFLFNRTTQQAIYSFKIFKPGTTGVQRAWLGAFAMPVGVTITDIKFGYLRTATASSLTLQLYRESDTTSFVLLASITNPSTGATYRSTHAAVSELVTSGRSYLVGGTIKTTSTGVGKGAELCYVDVSYVRSKVHFTY